MWEVFNVFDPSRFYISSLFMTHLCPLYGYSGCVGTHPLASIKAGVSACFLE